ncbi:hypothetical protein Q3G72_035143 [Acer saccharum]|nr:hypothetical protein Q3G72_035143 [Acer saccharum]
MVVLYVLGALIVVDSLDQSKAKAGDHKLLHRLAQNREAARKSRLRKKITLAAPQQSGYLFLLVGSS